MIEQTKRISFRISFVLSKVEPEPDVHTGSGSDQKVPSPTGSKTLLTGKVLRNQGCGTGRIRKIFLNPVQYKKILASKSLNTNPGSNIVFGSFNL